MTKQVYKSAQGKSIDLGTIKLRNEHVRAVGNMNVNARGDVLDSNNQVIETKSRQIQRQNDKLTNVVDTPVHTSSAAAKRARGATVTTVPPVIDDPTIDATVNIDTTVPSFVDDTTVDNTVDNTVTADTTVDTSAVDTLSVDSSETASASTDASVPTTGGGLAAAIARSKIIKQEKEKTARQQLQQTPGVRKI